MKNSLKGQNSIPAGTLRGTWPECLGFVYRIRTAPYVIDKQSLTQQNQISAAAITLTSKKRRF